MSKNKLVWVSFVLTLLAIGAAWADELPRARPEDLGFSAQRLDYIDEFYANEVKSGRMAGIVTLVARHGKIVHFGAVGYADVEKKRKMETDTIFRLYSMTKPVTATALMMLYQEGRFQLTDPVAKYIPAFSDLKVLHNPAGPLDDTGPMEHPPTIQDLLRHTAGFTHGLGTDFYDSQYTQANVFGLDVPLAEMVSKLAKIPLRYQPGTRFVYSVGPDIQARLVEILSGMSFDNFLQKRVFEPLQMQDAGFWLPADKAKRLATVHWMKDGKLIPLDEAHGHPEGGVLYEPWSVNSYTVDHKRKGGSFGLVATTEDYWRFAQMLLNGGQLNGIRLLSPQIVQYMTRDHLGTRERDWLAPGLGFGLGLAVMNDPAAAGYVASAGSYFWSGAAATDFWIDPKEDMVVVAMTQHLGVPGLNSETLRPQLLALIYSALLE